MWDHRRLPGTGPFSEGIGSFVFTLARHAVVRGHDRILNMAKQAALESATSLGVARWTVFLEIGRTYFDPPRWAPGEPCFALRIIAECDACAPGNPVFQHLSSSAFLAALRAADPDAIIAVECVESPLHHQYVREWRWPGPNDLFDEDDQRRDGRIDVVLARGPHEGENFRLDAQRTCDDEKQLFRPGRPPVRDDLRTGFPQRLPLPVGLRDARCRARRWRCGRAAPPAVGPTAPPPEGTVTTSVHHVLTDDEAEDDRADADLRDGYDALDGLTAAGISTARWVNLGPRWVRAAAAAGCQRELQPAE